MTFYDPETLRPIAPPEDSRTTGPPVAFSPDGKALYRLAAYDARHVAASHVRLVRQDLASGRRSQVLTLPPQSVSVDPLAGGSGMYARVDFSPDDKTLLLADGKTGSIQLRDRASGRVMHRLRGYGGYGFSAFSPDGRQLLVAYGDNTVRSWDVATGKEQGVLSRPPTSPTAMRFSPDGRFLALVDSVYEVVVWNAAGVRSLGKPLKRFQAHGGGTRERAFAFSPDGETLATGGVDGTIKMWNTRTWRLTLVLPQHGRMLDWLKFSPDGQRLYSHGRDKTLRVWRADAATPPLSTKGPIP
jgi:WD40 repeat protein